MTNRTTVIAVAKPYMIVKAVDDIKVINLTTLGIDNRTKKKLKGTNYLVLKSQCF